MSTKTSFKRVALVAVAALGMGVLTSVSPANAALDGTSVLTITDDNTVVRTDQSSATSTLVITTSGTGAIAAGDTITVNTFTRNGVALAAIPAGITVVNETNFVETQTSTAMTFEATSTTATVSFTIAKTMPTGKYTFQVGRKGSNSLVAGTFYVSTAPVKATFDKTTYSTEGTATTAAQVALKDAQDNPTWLNTGEAVQITSSAASAIASIVLLDSGNYTATTAKTGYVSVNLSNNAGTAGTYTFTAAGASGQTTFTSGSASLTVSAAAVAVESVALATGTLAVGRDTDDGVDRTTATNVSETLSNTDIWLSPTQTAVSFKLTETAQTTVKNFKVSIAQTSNVPFPGGVAATVAPVYVAATVDADGTGSTATYTVTSTSALAGTGYTITFEGGTYDIDYRVKYQAPVAYNINLFDAEATTIAAVKLATTSQKLKVTDQFGVAFAGAVISYTTATRNTVAVKTAVSGADGTATISTTDAALSTSTADDAFNATIPNQTVVGAAFDGTANTVIKYYATAAEITASAITLAVTQDSNDGGAYNNPITTATAPSVTVDTNLTNGTNALKLDDQIAVTATIANAAGTNPQGVPVSVSGSAGVYFLTGSSVGEVLVGAQTGAVTTLATYTNASGQYSFQAGFTKSGTATITVKSGSITKTYSIKVVAGAAGIVKAAASANGVVVATVTDLWGNPVSGASVAFVAASGALLGGNFPSLSATTGADGTASTVVTGAEANKSYVVSATISAGDSAVAADTTNGVPAGVATVDVTSQGSGQSDLNKLTVLINSLIKKMNALATLVAKIQKKLGVK